MSDTAIAVMGLIVGIGFCASSYMLGWCHALLWVAKKERAKQ